MHVLKIIHDQVSLSVSQQNLAMYQKCRSFRSCIEIKFQCMKPKACPGLNIRLGHALGILNTLPKPFPLTKTTNLHSKINVAHVDWRQVLKPNWPSNSKEEKRFACSNCSMLTGTGCDTKRYFYNLSIDRGVVYGTRCHPIGAELEISDVFSSFKRDTQNLKLSTLYRHRTCHPTCGREKSLQEICFDIIRHPASSIRFTPRTRSILSLEKLTLQSEWLACVILVQIARRDTIYCEWKGRFS